MRIRSVLYLSVLLLILLAGCSAAPEAPTSPTALIEVLASPTVEMAYTDSPMEPTQTPLPTATFAPPTQTAEPTATASPEPTLEPTQASFRVSEMDGMEQIYIPAGEFIMGTTDTDAQVIYDTNGRAYPEVPQFTYYLDGYWFDKYEVTNGQYRLCVEAGACDPPNLLRSTYRPHYYDDPEFDNYPVIYVNWYQASAYCEWAGRRLPTEAEWEKAARGEDGRRYPWGNEPITGERANFCDINCPRSHANPSHDDGYPDTAPVGSYPAGASPYGVMDMAGNVWEWTSTIVSPYPYDPNDGREIQDMSAERVWRGGPWSNGVWWIRASVRYRSVMFYWWGNLGFRCAASDGAN